MTTTFLQLPMEVIAFILEHLTASEILRAQLICKLFRSIILQWSALQLTIELYAAGRYLTTNSAKLPVATLLELLREKETRWRRLQGFKSTTVSVEFASTYLYELAAGRLFLGADSRTGLRDDDDNANQGNNDYASMTGFPSEDLFNKSSYLKFMDLPSTIEQLTHARDSSNSGGQPYVWRGLRLPLPIGDFALDGTQNLLVLLQRARQETNPPRPFNLHILTLDQAVSHPEAQHPILSAPIPDQLSHPALVWYWASIHICGSSLVGVFTTQQHTKDYMVVWNWRAGHVIAYGTAPNNGRIRSVALIAPNALAVPCLPYGAIDILTFDPDAPPSEQGSYPQFKLFQRLRLPDMSGDPNFPGSITYDEINTRSHPNPTTLPNSGFGLGPAHLFGTDDSEGIVVFSIEGRSGGYRLPQEYTLIIHRSTLLRSFSSIPAAPWPHHTRAVDWNTWGPQNSRCITGLRSSRWICWVHGHRLVEGKLWVAPPETDGERQGDLEETKRRRQLHTLRNLRHLIPHLSTLIQSHAQSQSSQKPPQPKPQPSSTDFDFHAFEWDISHPNVLDEYDDDDEDEMEEDQGVLLGGYYSKRDVAAILRVAQELGLSLPQLVEHLDSIDTSDPPPRRQKLYLKVYDFNPRSVKRSLNPDSQYSLPEVINDDTRLDLALKRGSAVVTGVSDENFKTNLPFIESVTCLELSPGDEVRSVGALLDGDNILVIKSNEETGKTETVQILNF